MARVTNAEIQQTRVTSEPLDVLPAPPPSRRGYGQGDLIDGKYRLDALIGTGGMGEVWTASNDTLGVRRAVKLIRADSDSAESTDRLLHEAQAAARLADPAIVRVFDFGRTERGDPYIVMELLEGDDLMSIISRRERLSPIKAVRVLLPVIRALAAAHEHGIVHRDLKPENIFLARLPDGRVQPKLLDFGIAKLKNARDLRLTSAGSVMGSPLYMAPEQARGEDVDERADIWAVCVVLYEAMTGQPPFGGEDRAQVMHAVATRDPEHPSERGVLEPAPWPIMQHGLEKRRDERWRSMDELGRALARWLLDAGVGDDITGASLDASWFRNSRRSLFASSLPPERAVVHGPGRARRWLSEAALRCRRTAQLLQGLGSLVWRRVERLDRKQRSALIAFFAALALTLLVLGSGGSTAAPKGAAAPAAALPVAAAPAAVAEPAHPAAAEPAHDSALAATAPASAPAPALTGASPANTPAAATKPPPAARTAAPRTAARASKARRAPARKPSRPPAADPPHETVTRARRAKLIDPYQ